MQIRLPHLAYPALIRRRPLPHTIVMLLRRGPRESHLRSVTSQTRRTWHSQSSGSSKTSRQAQRIAVDGEGVVHRIRVHEARVGAVCWRRKACIVCLRVGWVGLVVAGHIIGRAGEARLLLLHRRGRHFEYLMYGKVEGEVWFSWTLPKQTRGEC